MSAKTFTAKHDGRCAECAEVIQEGDLLAWNIAGRAIHADCGRPADTGRPPGPTCPVCFMEKATNGACSCE